MKHELSLPTVQEIPYQQREVRSLHDEALDIAQDIEPEDLGLEHTQVGPMLNKVETAVLHHGRSHADEVVEELIESVPHTEVVTIPVENNVLATGGLEVVIVRQPRAVMNRTRGAH
jgi:hypothetical protein